MIDYHKEFLKSLKTIMPNDVHYEMKLHSGTKTPCISYMELSNIDDATGDTLGYSRLVYQVKVWGHDIGTLQKYALEIDKVLRPIGFRRISSNELYDVNSSMIQKVMSYECLALEEY